MMRPPTLPGASSLRRESLLGSPLAASTGPGASRHAGTARARRHADVLIALLVLAVACAVYLQTLAYDFTYDDVLIVKERAAFHSLANWRAIVTGTWWARALYRPLTALTLAANWSAGGGDPRWFHLVNLLLHGAVTVLVFRLARGLLRPAGAAAAALLFAVHPVHVEAVANVVGRAEVLSALFALAAVLCYRADGARAARGDRGSWARGLAAFGTLLSVALALAAKESAFATPALLLAADWVASRRRGTRFADELRPHALLWFASVVVAFGWLSLRARMVGDLTGLEVAPGLDDLGLPARTLVMLPVVLHYLRLLFFPLRLSPDYSPNVITPATHLTAAGAAGALVLAALVGLGIAARRRAPVLTFALIWMGASLAIVANILVPTGVLLAERTLYLPSVGAVLALGWLAERVALRAPRVAALAVGLLVLAGAARTVARNPVWRNNDVFFPQLVRDARGSFRAEWVAAALSSYAGDQRRSEWHFRNALRIYPLGGALWADLARLMNSQGRFEEAARYYWTAWTLNRSETWHAESAVHNYVKAGALDSAETRLAEARRAVGDKPDLRLAESEILLARGQARRALGLRRLVAWQYPQRARHWALVAEAALAAGRCPEALRALSRVEALKRDYADLPKLRDRAREANCR